MSSYSEKLEKLFAYGTPEPVGLEDWPDYLASSITIEDTPELLRMIADPTLRTTDPDEEDPKYWAAVHAWRTIALLRDASATAPLLQLTENLFDNDSGFSEWAIEELPDVYEAIGPAAIPILINCIADVTWPVETRVNAMTGLLKICTKYPEYRDEVVAFFTKQLENYAQNDPEINGYLISNLSHLKAIETLPLIKTAFDSENVDDFLISLEDVEVLFGLRERPEPLFSDLNSFFQALSQPKNQEDATPSSPALFPQRNSIPKANKNKKTKKALAKASR